MHLSLSGKQTTSDTDWTGLGAGPGYWGQVAVWLRLVVVAGQIGLPHNEGRNLIADD